jgi:hypothetical protein
VKDKFVALVVVSGDVIGPKWPLMALFESNSFCPESEVQGVSFRCTHPHGPAIGLAHQPEKSKSKLKSGHVQPSLADYYHNGYQSLAP